MTDVRATANTAARRLSSAEAATARSAPSSIPLWIAIGLVAANTALIVWLWAHGGNVTHVRSTGDLLVSIARITGLLGAYSALVQVLLLARIPDVERLGRLRPAHRLAPLERPRLPLPRRSRTSSSRSGATRLLDRLPLGKETSTDARRRDLPRDDHRHGRDGPADRGRRELGRRSCAGGFATRPGTRSISRPTPAIALAWFHQIPTGNELVLDQVAADYWRGLYLVTLALLIGFRVLVPLANAFRLPAARRRGRRRGRRASSRSASQGRGLDRLRRARRPVLPLALPHARPLVGVAPVLALGGARRPLAADHDQGARRLHRAASASIKPGTRVARRGPVRRLHRRRPAPQKVAADRAAASGSPRSGRCSRRCTATS